MMQGVTRLRTTAQWIALLQDRAVPCGPINDIAQAFSEAQAQARGLVVQQSCAPTEPSGPNTIQTIASPLRLSATPVVLRYPPPQLGEHTQEVLEQLGLDAQQIRSLGQEGVI